MKFLDRIDDYFYSRPKKEFTYMVVLIIGIIGFLIYYYVYPVANRYESVQEKKYMKLSTEYNTLKNSINLLRLRVSALSKRLKQRQTLLANLKKQKVFYSELANLLDFAEFDQYKWANIVRESVADAKSKGLEVKKVENKIFDVNVTKNSKMPQIVKRMDIGIKLIGKYKNFIYYLYSYEDRKELIRVKEMNITSPATFYVKFSIYGYNK
jgi:hypothetical protein